MPNTPIEVLAITSAEDVSHFFMLAARAFGPADVSVSIASDWQRQFTGSPEFDPRQLRGVYQGDTLIAGCTYVERWMNMHGARMKVGCVGAVVTDPAYRKRGAARLMMEDVNALAWAHECSFVLLHGFEFYLRWGYADVFDNSVVTIDRARVLSLPPNPYSIRPATEADAAAWLDLFNSHYGTQSGGFERSEALQAHNIRWMRSLPSEASHLSGQPPTLTVDPSGNVCGYLQFTFAPLEVFGIEPTAVDWPAALALLSYQARLCESLSQPPEVLHWRVKPGSSLFDMLADHVAINVVTDVNPNSGWMARLASATAAINALLPAWSIRWANSARLWQGVLALEIGDERFALDLTCDAICLTSAPASARIHLTPQVFTQLAFGHRSACWAAGQTDQYIPTALLPMLDVLFPRASIWLAPSDAF